MRRLNFYQSKTISKGLRFVQRIFSLIKKIIEQIDVTRGYWKVKIQL